MEGSFFIVNAKTTQHFVCTYILLERTEHIWYIFNVLRVMFFYFSSAFNTIQPPLLGAGADGQLISWTIDYLINRPRWGFATVSEVIVCSTGAPQGTVLSPFLFTLYTSELMYNTSGCHLHKFSDDSDDDIWQKPYIHTVRWPGFWNENRGHFHCSGEKSSNIIIMK